MHFLTAPSPSLLSPPLTPSVFPSLYFSSGSTGRVRFAVLNEPASVLDSLWKGNCYKSLCCSCSGFLRRCKDWDVEFSSLESQILEFMQSSDNPEAFPTKEELVAAGRVDLVNAIVKEGGWLSFGWGLDDGSGEIRGFEDTSEDNATRASGVSSSRTDESVEIKADESGIDGILNRLEKQRNSSLGLGFIEKGDGISSTNNEDKDEDESDHRTTTDGESSSDYIAKLSDAWEFQENEIMNAHDRLRSIRAKLAVLEGKMALAIMNAHKVVEEKQKKINKAQKALQMLKTTCVVWPNNASEVFLSGSFDGWSTKRKMEKLSSGMFSVSLQLYPGRYEMKFIVDGEWKIDPLRPAVTNNGHENNLLIVSD